MSKNFSTVLRHENDKYYKFTGVDAWHAAGYYGERVIAASAEEWDINDYNPDNLILIPFGNGKTGTNWHDVATAKTFHQVAPMAKIVQLPCMAIRTGSVYDSRFIKESIPYIKEHGVHIMFKSTSASHHKDLDVALAEVKDFFILTCSAGNNDDSSYNGWAESPYVASIPAYQISGDGRFRIEGYSSETEYNDFAGPSWVAIPPTGYTQGGTSFSNPWVAGMMALVDDLFIEKTGKPLTNEMMQQLFRDYSIDIGDEGFDVKTGFGKAFLPPPHEIDIAKYSSVPVPPIVTPNPEPEIPEPEPETPVTPPTEEKTPLYRVQVGAFGIKANAEKLAAELQALGYPVLIKVE